MHGLKLCVCGWICILGTRRPFRRGTGSELAKYPCTKVLSVGPLRFSREENSNLLPRILPLTPFVLGAWQAQGAASYQAAYRLSISSLIFCSAYHSHPPLRLVSRDGGKASISPMIKPLVSWLALGRVLVSFMLKVEGWRKKSRNLVLNKV